MRKRKKNRKVSKSNENFDFSLTSNQESFLEKCTFWSFDIKLFEPAVNCLNPISVFNPNNKAFKYSFKIYKNEIKL